MSKKDLSFGLVFDIYWVIEEMRRGFLDLFQSLSSFPKWPHKLLRNPEKKALLGRYGTNPPGERHITRFIAINHSFEVAPDKNDDYGMVNKVN